MAVTEVPGPLCGRFPHTHQPSGRNLLRAAGSGGTEGEGEARDGKKVYFDRSEWDSWSYKLMTDGKLIAR